MVKLMLDDGNGPTDGCMHAAIGKYQGNWAAGQDSHVEHWADGVLLERAATLERRAADLELRLARDLEAGTLVPVVGAGVAMSCGLPGWGTLLDEVCAQALEDRGFVDPEVMSVLRAVRFYSDPLALAQAVTAVSSPARLAQLVSDCLYRDEATSSPLLTALAGLIRAMYEQRARGRPAVVLTFNYDTLLEETLEADGVPVRSIGRTDQPRSLSRDHVNVWHVHGVLPRPGADLDLSEPADDDVPIVLTEASYGDAYLRGSVDPLSRVLADRSTPLFVGFSFRDPYVRQILMRHAIHRDAEPVGVGLMATPDLVDARRLRTADAHALNYTLNDEHGFGVSGRDLVRRRADAVRSVPRSFARWMLYSIGVEWLEVQTRRQLPQPLLRLSESRE